MADKIKIGTRGSKLAMIQTDMVREQLQAHHPDLEVEIIEILTSGDWTPSQGETRLCEAEGGKGLFAREIERAIFDGEIDCGVHSMKDMPSFLPDGLVIEHILPREDPRDAFLANAAKTIDDLPQGALVGTSSLRRQAFLLARRPDLKIVPLRGNVPTRLAKLRDGQVDATILAVSGLKRLGLDHEIASVIAPEVMLPAAAQGAVGIEIRADDDRMREILAPLHCRESGLCVAAERAALQILDGSCHTPIGAQAKLDDEGKMKLIVTVVSEDGTDIYKEEHVSPVADHKEAVAIGVAVGVVLKKIVPPELLAA